MAASLGIFFAVLSMLAFGISDLLVKKAAEKVGPYFTFFYRSIFTVGLLFLYFFIFIKDVKKLFIPTNLLVITLVMGLLGFAAFLAYCKAMQVGKISIISPVSHTSVLLTILLAIIFFKEHLTVLQGIAVALIIAGIMCVSFKPSEIIRLKPGQMVKGLPYALITMFCWGMLYFIIKIPTLAMGPFITALYLETLSLIYLALLLPFKKIEKPAASTVGYLAVIGAFSAIGSPLSTLAIKHAGAALATPIIFAVPLVTIALAFIFLKERLEPNQLASVLAICAGIILAAI